MRMHMWSVAVQYLYGNCECLGKGGIWEIASQAIAIKEFFACCLGVAKITSGGIKRNWCSVLEHKFWRLKRDALERPRCTGVPWDSRHSSVERSAWGRGYSDQWRNFSWNPHSGVLFQIFPEGVYIQIRVPGGEYLWNPYRDIPPFWDGVSGWEG